MARPIAVVLQEFANVGAAAVATPTQGVCLIGRCTVERSKALNGSDLMLPYSDSTVAFVPPLGKPNMVITSATMRLSNAEVEMATHTVTSGEADGVTVTIVGHHVVAGDMVYVNGEEGHPVVGVVGNVITLADDLTEADELSFRRTVADVVLEGDILSALDKVAFPATPEVTIGTASGLTVLSAEYMYPEYTADRYDMDETVLAVTPSNYTDLLGPATTNNPLALAAQLAFANAGAQTIYCVGIAGSATASATAFTAVIGQLFSFREIYALVPLCESHATAQAVATALRAELESQANADTALSTGVAQRFRIAVVGGYALTDTATLVNGAAVTYVSESGDDVTLSSTTANFVTAGVVAGDTVSTVFSSTRTGVVKQVISNQRIVVTSAALAGAISSGSGTITITHTKSYADKAAEAASLNGIDSRRVYIAWQPVTASVGGSPADLGSQYLAAAVGGLIAGLPPHAAITNLGIGGITGIRNNRYTELQFTTMSNAGVLVFKQDTASGAPYCIHGVSSDKSGLVPLTELSMVKVFDYAAAYFQARQERFLSGWNINEQTIGFIKADLEAGIAALKSQRYAKLGSVIIDATLVSVAQNATITDKVESEILVQFPRPLNTLSLRLVSQ